MVCWLRVWQECNIMQMLWFPESRQPKKLDQMKYLYANDMGLLGVENDPRKKTNENPIQVNSLI